jgi:sugar/nucleoside kinase (ribokinase family)
VTQRPEVVVIGDAVLDVTARPAAPIRARTDVPAQVRIGCGGQGANLAVRLARRGVAVELVCALGDDPSGAFVRQALVGEGVELSAVRTDATGTVVILVDQHGERTMLSQRASFAGDAAAAVRGDVPWQVVSGYLLLEPDAGQLVSALGAMPASRALVGCTLPTEMVDGWARAATAMRPELVVLNRDEALALLPAGQDTDDLPARLGERLGFGVVVTDPSGATARLNGLSAAVRAPVAVPASDTTGAGDAFGAALIASLLRSPWPPAGQALKGALAAASELASAVAHTTGAQARVAGELEADLRP